MNDDSLIGHQLGNFQLERILGHGGMGQVYYGRDIKLNRPVAVKVIDLRFRNNPAYAIRFVREAQAVATWRHENIAQVYYADEQDGLYYFAMEYIDGHDLGQILSSYALTNELIPQADALRIGRAVASALDYAHTKDVIHRDVKPSNVIVAHDGRVVLTDFGLALDIQQGSVGEVFGTAHYIAPEQARRSSDATAQSDLYSLGIMLYEMLTGVVPFDDPSPTSVAVQHITQEPPSPRAINPRLNAATEAVLLKSLSKAQQDRYVSGDALMTALEDAFQGSFLPAAPSPLPPLPAGTSFPARPTTSQPPTIKTPPAAPPRKAQRTFLPWLTAGGCFLIGLILLVLVLIPLSGLLLNLIQPHDAGISPTKTASPTGQAVQTIRATKESATMTPTAQPQLPAATSTVLYPNGKRFMLFYNDNSFYFLNLSKSDIPINWVAFERLSNADTPLNRFDGALWGKYYGTSTPDRCMALQVLESAPYLNPSECGHNNLYLSLRTPTRDDPVLFWTAEDGSHQFRVLWRENSVDKEVARCEIDAGTCEVYFP